MSRRELPRMTVVVVLSLVCLAPAVQLRAASIAPGLSNEEVPADWWLAVQEQIRLSEYHITWQEHTCLPELDAAYQAPNRAHNLRAFFTQEGLKVVSRTATDPAWTWSMSLAHLGRKGDEHLSLPTELAIEENRAVYRREALIERYENGEDGLVQQVEVDDRPRGAGPLVLGIGIESDLEVLLAPNGLSVDGLFDGQRVLGYGNVQAVDAIGSFWPVHISLDGAELRLWIEDAHAAYPLTVQATLSGSQDVQVDGLSPVPNWSGESNLAEARFGESVATAGDIDGDGYSDVIVGSPCYDVGWEEEGRAWVYRGSAGGLATLPAWSATVEPRMAHAFYGASVATAGDINGDGCSDIVVGARLYTQGEYHEGAAFVYYGSPSGLHAAADWKVESNQEQAYLGESVGTAGDVNRDGYSDVIIGASGYDAAGSSDRCDGAVFVWYGSATGLSTDGTSWNADWTFQGETGSNLGRAVGTAGDVNADGYADVIVGGPTYSGGQEVEGSALVFLGSSSGLGTAPAWRAVSNQSHVFFGCSVGTAGDVNGDGYADIIVGADRHGWPGQGYAYVWHGSANGLGSDGTPANADWAVAGQDHSYLGGSVGTAGDINGDGYADVIVGASHFYLTTDTETGWAFAYYGSAAGLSVSYDWSYGGKQEGDALGAAVSTAGDVNGDGYADVIVGAPWSDHGQTDQGQAYVYHGSPVGLTAPANWTGEINHESAHFGYAVASAGDVNSDGYGDVIVGAPWYDNGEYREGCAFVYMGSATGLSPASSWAGQSDQVGAQYGTSVSTAGDVNGNGYDGVLVGAPYYDHGHEDEGSVFLYNGSAAGLSASPSWRAEGDQEDAYFGASLGTAGDVNGDGCADIIVGAPGYEDDRGTQDEGSAFVWDRRFKTFVPGTPSNADWTVQVDQRRASLGACVATAGDVNGDGYSDVIIGAPSYDTGAHSDAGMVLVFHGSRTGLGSLIDWEAVGDQDSAEFGDAVGTAGDVNGDGYADVVVGARYYDGSHVNEGAAFCWYGSAQGIKRTGLPESANWSVEGDQTNARFGCSVGTAGDVNGDGYAEVIVGAYLYDGSYTDEGRAYLYYGSAEGTDAEPLGWKAIGEQDNAYFGHAVGTAGDVNGDGYADVIVGAYYYDAGQMDEGRAFVYYGNKVPGLSLRPRQWRADNSGPVAHLGMSDSSSRFLLLLTGRTPFGRGKVKTEWEVKPLGMPFDGMGTGQSAVWLDTYTAGTDLSNLVSGLAADTPYHWRMRLLYDPATTPFQQHSRWLTVPWNGWNEQDLRTSEGMSVYLPLTLRSGS